MCALVDAQTIFGADDVLVVSIRTGEPTAGIPWKDAKDWGLVGYFRAFLGLSRDGRIRMPVRGFPGPLLLVALVMNRFRREIAAPGLPLLLQRAIWRALAFIGRLLGKRASFPEYGAP